MSKSDSDWFCYLVECADRSLYCGIATNLERRLQQHNGELIGGAKYTSARRPVKLQASWQFANRSEASKYEYQLKKLNRQQKLALIAEQQKSR